jgi:hypothetical protein
MADIDLVKNNQAELKPLKPIPKELLNKFYQQISAKAAEKYETEQRYHKQKNGTHTITIFTTNMKQSKAIINEINHLIIHQMGPFLEEETGEDRGEFFRNITLFESTVEDNSININW